MEAGNLFQICGLMTSNDLSPAGSWCTAQQTSVQSIRGDDVRHLTPNGKSDKYGSAES